MNREIKFRVWDGELIHYSDDNMPTKEIAFGAKQQVMNAWSQGGEHLYGMDIKNIMEFTGMIDAAGKEIYDGDVVSGGLYTGVVQKGIYEMDSHGGGMLTWIVQNPNKASGFVLLCDAQFNCREEVIGNIYENPHLLK